MTLDPVITTVTSSSKAYREVTPYHILSTSNKTDRYKKQNSVAYQETQKYIQIKDPNENIRIFNL
ncbi:hypothetical protein [Chryseobacterium gossypii]|uniref:hypothetical protein n=1 Tax=Chryseobacterium gossypii TaxID=3231602 RepID=UPI003525AB9C